MYRQDRAWADACTSQLISILTPWMAHLAEIVIAPVEQDNKQATDYTINPKGSTIAARIRRPDCSYRDLTIRSRRANGAETELSKLKKGYASRYFYAWTDKDFKIIAWMLLNLDIARDAGLLERAWPERANKDPKTKQPDGTYFISIPIRALYEAKCMIASHKIPTPAPPRLVPLTPADTVSFYPKKKPDMDVYTTLWEGAQA